MWKTFAWPTAGFLNESSRVEFELIAAAEDEWFIRCLERQVRKHRCTKP